MAIKLLVSVFLLVTVLCRHTEAACQTIVINGANDWLPISYRDDEAHLNGVAVKVMEEIAQSLDLELDVRAKTSWSKLFSDLDLNEIDMVVGAYYNEERARKYLYSNAFFQNQARVFVKRKKRITVNSYKDLVGHKGARPKGGSFGQSFDEFDRANLNMLQVQTSKETPLMRWLVNGNVDFIIADLLDGRLAMRRMGLSKEVTALPFNISVNDVHFIMAKTSPCAYRLPQINHVIQEMKETGRIQEIVEGEVAKLIR